MSDPAGPSGRKCSKTEVSRDDELKTTKAAVRRGDVPSTEESPGSNPV